MNLYCKNAKPFVYAVFSGNDSKQAIPILQKINEEGILFWYSDQFPKREIKRIEAAYACVIFISKHAVHDEKVRHCIEYAVKHNKKILCIFLDQVSLSPALELLLNSLQSIDKSSFGDEAAFLEKLISAEVFSNVSITKAQKRFAKRRALASVFIPIASAVVIFFAVIVPLLIVPMAQAANGSLSKVGFGNLSLAELAEVEDLYVVGTQSYEQEYYASYIDDKKQEVIGHLGQKPTGDISDISDLALLKNAKRISFEANEISDISPIYNIKSLEWLCANCNPIKSIDGIEELQNLTDVSFAFTEISDITPLYQIPSLNSICIVKTYVNNLEGIENLPHLISLRIGGSNITDISPLNKIDFSYVNEMGGFIFEAEGIHMKDYSPLQRIPKFNLVGVTVRSLDEILPYINNKEVACLDIMESDIRTIDSLSSIYGIQSLSILNSYQLESLSGIEVHEGLTDIRMVNCPNIADYTPLLQLPNLKLLTMTSDMKRLASVQLKDADFEIFYEDEGR